MGNYKGKYGFFGVLVQQAQALAQLARAGQKGYVEFLYFFNHRGIFPLQIEIIVKIVGIIALYYGFVSVGVYVAGFVRRKRLISFFILFKSEYLTALQNVFGVEVCAVEIYFLHKPPRALPSAYHCFNVFKAQKNTALFKAVFYHFCRFMSTAERYVDGAGGEVDI